MICTWAWFGGVLYAAETKETEGTLEAAVCLYDPPTPPRLQEGIINLSATSAPQTAP